MSVKVGKETKVAFGAAAFSGASKELPDVFPRTMGPNTLRYLKEVVDSGLRSDIAKRFNEKMAQMHGVEHALGFPGCTPALFAAAMAVNGEPGDEVIISSIADYGSVMGFLYENFVPVFADTEPGTALISARTIEPHITDRTRAIVAVHFLGLPCDMDPIMALAKKHNLMVIEDVCQAILSRYKGRIAGSIGDIGTFSFDSEKTCGADTGGALITNNTELFEKVTFLTQSRGAVGVPGFGRTHMQRGNALRISQCTAATCLGNLEILEEQVVNRTAMARLLDDQIREVPGIEVYDVPEDRTHSYWLYGFRIDPDQFTCTPQEFAGQMREEGIPNVGLGRYYLMNSGIKFLSEYVKTGVYPFSVPPASRGIDYSPDTTPNARNFLDTFIRWFWTEKYDEGNIVTISKIIRHVAERNR